MTREQAINSMISHGFKVEQVGEIIKAVTPQLSSELEKNSKKLENPTTKNNLGVDCISREQALRELKESAEHHANDSREEMLLRRDRDIIRALPSVTPQESTIKALGEELRKARKGITDEKVLIGYNMAVAICNKHLGETEVDNGNDDN